jgi:hypothetical protein
MQTKIAIELQPVYNQLVSEGFEVYTYDNHTDEISSLYWYENGRVLDIQPSIWRRSYNPDLYNLGVSYIPSSSTGSGCRLSPENGMGTAAEDLLKYRHEATWVRDAKHYTSMVHFLKGEKVLNFYQIGF